LDFEIATLLANTERSIFVMSLVLETSLVLVLGQLGVFILLAVNCDLESNRFTKQLFHDDVDLYGLLFEGLLAGFGDKYG
jgi:hypothetical protein